MSFIGESRVYKKVFDNNKALVTLVLPSADINVGNLDEYVGRHGNKFKRSLEK